MSAQSGIHDPEKASPEISATQPSSAVPPDAAGAPLTPTTDASDVVVKDGAADEIPDGGLVAWLQVLGSWVILMDTWGLINTFGVFQTYYERVLLPGVPATQISWIGSLQGALLMMSGPLVGSLYDAGYFRHLLLTGIFLIILGQFMTSLASEYHHFILAQGICIGLGCGMTFLPSTAILSQYFRRRRGFVIGIASTGSPLAGMIFPVIFAQVEPSLGFGWATRAIAFVLLTISIVPALFMRPRIPTDGRRRSLIDTSALKEVPFVLVLAGGFFSFLTLYVGFFYIQLFAVQNSIGPESFSTYFVTILNGGSILGRVGPNYLADFVGALNIMTALVFVSAIFMFAWLGIMSFGGLIAFAVLYGASSGGVVSVSPTVIVSLTQDMGRVGTRMGMMFFVCGLPILFGTPIAGAIVGSYSRAEWLATIGYGAAGLTTGGVCLAFARLYQLKRPNSAR